MPRDLVPPSANRHGGPGRRLAFVVPSLAERAAQDEDTVQLLLFASIRLEDELRVRASPLGKEAAGAGREATATIVAVERDLSGWRELSALFPEDARRRISVEALPEPATPNLAMPGHKAAYDLFEYLKQRAFDEVHCLDYQGLAFYPTQAKRLGLYFLETLFAVHVVGSTVFRKEAEDNLLQDVGALMDDLLERGGLERADLVYVHDRRAWCWYADKIEPCGTDRVLDLAWPLPAPAAAPPTPPAAEAAPALLYYGPLGAEGGLPLFCDVVARLLPKLARPVEVVLVGPPRPIGGMDAVSYIRLRSAKWGVPVTIKRDLSIADEVSLLSTFGGVAFCDARRRESLRSRLLAGLGLPVLSVQSAGGLEKDPSSKGYPASPGRLADAVLEMLARQPPRRAQATASLVELWRAGRPDAAAGAAVPPSSPLPSACEPEPKVSVCITHFCRPQKLRTALASLQRQTYRNFEVIVVDDGSPDPEVQRELDEIRREIEPLGWRVVVQENRYLGAARNFGASHATGEYLIFMDDDNVAMPHEISTLVAVAQRTGAEIVTSFCNVFENERDLTSAAPPRMRFTPFGPDPALGALSNCFGDANALYARAVFEQLGGFTEDYGITHEDWEFFCRASLEDVPMVCVPEPLFWYRMDQSAMFRGERTQLHKSANLRRHVRPFLQKLPYYQAKLVQLAQGLSAELPLTTVGPKTRAAGPRRLRRQAGLPYGRVAVVTRTKDRPLLLRRAIRSVLDQTFEDWLLVIVNDGGKPESVELVCDEFAEELAGRVLVLHHPVSLGMQTASNAGASACDSDFIVIHDDDDTWERTFLARTVSHLDERGWNPKSGGVITWSQVIVEELRDAGEIQVHDRFIFNSNLHNLSLLEMAVENRFPPISFLFRRVAMEVVGPFREQHGVLGDWEFHLRLLRRFDIDVIAEPLANYHHRSKNTQGIYGNSVHVQQDVHRAKRAALINEAVRGEGDAGGGLTRAQLLALGDLQHQLLAEQGREFQRLRDYVGTFEERINFIAARVSGTRSSRGSRNLVSNGDFRTWPGPRRTRRATDGNYAFTEICPGFFLCFDGDQVSYRVERSKWIDDGVQLPYGKTYLHLEHDGRTRNGTWFVLECLIPSVLRVAGQRICISGISGLRGAQSWILVGGRHILGGGRQLTWPDHRVSIGAEFGRWSCSLTCPSVVDAKVRGGHHSRIFLKLPHDQPFEFDLTNLQVELGGAPTEFEYTNGVPMLRHRLSHLWSKTAAKTAAWSGAWRRNGRR